MILLVGRAVGGLPSTDGQMDEVWTVSSDEAAGTVTLTLRAGPRPLVATLTEAEMFTVVGLLPDVAAIVRRQLAPASAVKLPGGPWLST